MENKQSNTSIESDVSPRDRSTLHVSRPSTVPNDDNKNGGDVSSPSYQANTDPVYEEFAVNPCRISSASHLVRPTQVVAHVKSEPRKRVTSVSISYCTEVHHDNKSVNMPVRPSTTDGNCAEKRGSQVFWEDLNNLSEHNERGVLERKDADDGTLPAIEAEGPTGPKGQGSEDSRPKSTSIITKPASGAPPNELPKLKDKNTESKNKQSSASRAQIPPQPLVRFNSSGDFKAVVDDLYGENDKRKSNVKPTKWINIKRMAMPSARSRVRSQTGTNHRANILTLKQREEKAIKLKEAAAHGWRVIRWYIEHQRLRKYASGGALGWTVVKQHLSNMSDVETARQDIYRRYGVIPTQQSDGTFKTVNVMRPRKRALKLVAFKTVKQTTPERNAPKPPAFRQTLLK